jgi:hypothetical protein
MQGERLRGRTAMTDPRRKIDARLQAAEDRLNASADDSFYLAVKCLIAATTLIAVIATLH